MIKQFRITDRNRGIKFRFSSLFRHRPRKLMFFNKLQRENYATYGDTVINYRVRSYVVSLSKFCTHACLLDSADSAIRLLIVSTRFRDDGRWRDATVEVVRKCRMFHMNCRDTALYNAALVLLELVSAASEQVCIRWEKHPRARSVCRVYRVFFTLWATYTHFNWIQLHHLCILYSY